MERILEGTRDNDGKRLDSAEPGAYFRHVLPQTGTPDPDGTHARWRGSALLEYFYQEVIYSHIDEQELVQEYGIQYELAKILAAQANAAIDAGSKPSELELGRWNEYRAQVSACLEKSVGISARWI